MDIAETMQRARDRELLADRFFSHQLGYHGDDPLLMYATSAFHQAFCSRCNVLFTRGKEGILEEAVEPLMDG